MKTKKTTTPMSFEEVLNSEYKSLIEDIEHGTSDPELMAWFKAELLEKTGYSYID